MSQTDDVCSNLLGRAGKAHTAESKNGRTPRKSQTAGMALDDKSADGDGMATVTRVEVLVIGAGHAGLAVSRHLTDSGTQHLVVEEGGVGEAWRSRRWDSFRLGTPTWSIQLPGLTVDDAQPDGFLTAHQMQALLTRYAASFDAPVRTGLRITALRPTSHGWRADTKGETFHARRWLWPPAAISGPGFPASQARCRQTSRS